MTFDFGIRTGSASFGRPQLSSRSCSSFALYKVEKDVYKFHILDLSAWEPGNGPSFYNVIIKLVNGRDLVEDVRHALAVSRLARTTIMTLYGPSSQSECGSKDCLINFDSPEKSEEVMAKINPLFSELSMVNVSCLAYHHWDTCWSWSGSGPPPEGFGPTGTAWKHDS